MSKFILPLEVTSLIDKFLEAGFQLYIVGGAVRDLILERSVNDWDFTTDATPEEILKVIPEGFYNNKFGTVGVNSSSLIANRESPEETINDTRPTIYEITTMRKEGKYTDFRHPEKLEWTKNINEDLARRDFTINALALDHKQNIVDPLDGQKDLQQKIIQAVGDPNQRFKEDALRLIRAIRIATQLGFEIEKNTYMAIKENSNLIKNIASERIRDELFKLLVSENASEGIRKLRETGILQIILPELERCFGIKQEGPKHDREYDIGEHSLAALNNTPSTDPIVRFSALLHDIGKPDTVETHPDGNVTFYNHEIVGSRIAADIARRFNLSKKQSEKVFKLVRFHMFTLDENQTDSAIRRFIKNIGLENVDDMMALRVGDRLGGGTSKAVSWRMKIFRERIDEVMTKPFSLTDLKVNGQDVMEALNIPPSRKVGEILDELFKEVQEDSSKNTREYLVGRIKTLNDILVA